MRLLLIVSIAAAIAALGAVAYQFRPRGGSVPAPSRAQTAMPDPAPAPPAIRSIPIRPKEAPDAGPSPAPTGAAVAPKAPDVLAGVSSTLDDLRRRETAEGRDGPVITPGQVEALKAQAERRHVRPVTRMSFPLEPGTTVPQQVFLHPTPPELAGLAPAGDSLGFILVGDKLVLVGMASRRIVAVAKG
ncbi:DUF1236 domain-containing protein [Methylobacterium aerolatum]|uniref:Uncharacterized protein n=1 Tax=Methylobacterium aerolatum TaxID=418708 RepID=A0ABU0HX09_9HYPH|nr:DUF1236 domain-containing protein [Methylobacterium aerolatum]MDQ0446021.1 hypothetical protein [Methylobacterium aerolatum]GJD35058.1 hypothetical protein FMGBMHLM_1965 [Methylobacterium aerolatum]